ncbi:biotin synthase BioB [Psychromonas sp. PT13]|uniref:biotin synthase BioB n=1 Tax=Psychromonas sp. PT13 TaxID=3439547 RepID=UPI003EBDE1BE
MINTNCRHDWTIEEVESMYEMPFMDLIFNAQTVHRANFTPNQIQVSTLLSIKTGACPEDCKYCPQSARYDTGLENQQLMEVDKVLHAAKEAKKNGSTRFCMGAAWKNPKQRDMPYLVEMIKQVKALGMESCMTLGMLDRGQADQLSDAGLDYYNHNLDTSPEYYGQIITTRSYQDRLETLNNVRSAGMKVCSGGILGLGEAQVDRAGLLVQLANLPTHPESVPINKLVKVAGTPLDNVDDLDEFTFIKSIAIARIMMPRSYVRLSAGREDMSEQTQALCFMAGANSIFYGCKLLTTANPDENTDRQLFKKLGINKSTVNLSPSSQETSVDAAIVRYREKDELFYDATSVS